MPTRPLRHRIPLTLAIKLHLFLSLLVACGLASPVSIHAQGNGISVGQAKVYDNQSLQIMLDQLYTQLTQVRVIDQQSLVKALGYSQGSQQQDVVSNFNASVSLTPKAAAADSGSSKSNSTSSPGSSSKGSSTDNTSTGSSNASALPELLAAPSYKPDYGESSIDLLSDQVDLTYQIFNLRMLLERSVTDRLLNGSPRRQAVVSFNITIDPPKDARDAAAYVEVTLSSTTGPISLVASMPQEKTYNASALSSSSKSFGGSAVAKIVSISYNQRKRNQIFYLYRDSDTLAIERSPVAVGNAVTFGWTFRPVLGRRSVSPGMRQMFAVIALPNQDLVGDGDKEKGAFPTVQASAKTYWLHYDRSTSTTAVRGYPGFWAWRAERVPIAEEHTLEDIKTLPTDSIENGLKPTIDHVQRFQTTDGSTVLQITGTNFFTGTSVTIGDKTFASPQDGLVLKSSQTMLLTASTDILSKALSAVVNGRYGPSVPLYPKASVDGIVIVKSQLIPVGPNFTNVEVIVGDPVESHDFVPAMIQGFPDLILTLNGTPIPYRPLIGGTTDTIFPYLSRRYVIATVKVPNSLLHPRDNRVGILFPLLGENWSAESLIYDADEVQITRMTNGPSTTLLIARPGMEFNKNWKLILDKSYSPTDPVSDVPAASAPANGKSKGGTSAPPVQFSFLLPCKRPDPQKAERKDTKDTNGCYILKIVANSDFLKNYQKLLLVADNGYAQLLDVPADTSGKTGATSPPTVSTVDPPTVGLDEVLAVTITGTGLDGVKEVSFGGKPLSFWTPPGKVKSSGVGSPPVSVSTGSSSESANKTQQIEVLLSRDVTSKSGRQELLLQVDAKNMATATVVVAPKPGAPKPPNATTPSGKSPQSGSQTQSPNSVTPSSVNPNSEVPASTPPKPKTE